MPNPTVAAVIPNTPEDEQRARITVCANSENTEEAIELLAMLGLL